MSLKEMVALASVEHNMDTSRIISQQLSDQNGLYGSIADAGGFLYTPPRSQFGGASIPDSCQCCRNACGQLGSHCPVHGFPPPSSRMVSGQAAYCCAECRFQTGLCSSAANELIRFGFNVVSVKTTRRRKTKRSCNSVNQSSKPAAKRHPIRIRRRQSAPESSAGSGDVLCQSTGKSACIHGPDPLHAMNHRKL